MIVSLDASGALRLEDARNCRAFSFHSGAGPVTDTDAVVFADGAAWVCEAALRAWPPLAADDAWQSDLTGMIGYAKRMGWVDAVTGRIRAHILEPKSG